MKKILFTTQRPSNAFLANKIAEQNPTIQVDHVGNRIENKSPNLKWLGEDLDMTIALNRLKSIYKGYDFIFAADLFWALDTDFQDWRAGIGIPIFCTSREAAHLEYSKLTTKEIFKKINIPTPDYEIIEEDSFGRIKPVSKHFLESESFVIKMNQTFKTNGFQTQFVNKDTYINLIHKQKRSCSKMFVENRISGKEFSAHFLCNGTELVYIGSARDYKKFHEGDQGFNTGSTGSYSSVEYVTKEIENTVTLYAKKILSYLNERDIEYKGFMYLGCLIDSNGIVNVLEINARVGNPEFSTILETYENVDLLEQILLATEGKQITPFEISKNKMGVTVNLINKNYSDTRLMNVQYPAIPDIKFTTVYFDRYLSGGNLYKSLVHSAETKEKAAQEIFNFLDQQDLKDFTYRKDIGYLE